MDVTTGVLASPVVTVTPNGGTAGGTTLVGCTYSPAAAGFPLAGGVTATCTYTYIVVAGGPDGLATVVATASDQALNVGSDSDAFLIDTTPPAWTAAASPNP